MNSQKDYLNSKYGFMLDSFRIGYHVSISASQKDSVNEPLIWVADYVAGAVYTLTEHGEKAYVDRVSNIFFDCAYF